MNTCSMQKAPPTLICILQLIVKCDAYVNV